ncbi:MAG: adenylate kinase [Chloroflexi bacterium]|nr:adenylate kinase [Chloroflexota bacterium]
MRVILLGAPGAGKGTQAGKIGERLSVPHIATGDLFRAAVSQGTELGKLAKSYMDQGELVPDQVTVRMLLERLSQPDCRKGYILDGFPRTLEQAQALDTALAERGDKVDRTIYLEVSEAELVRRLSGRWICPVCQTPYHEVTNPPRTPRRCDKEGAALYQRDDDKPETVKTRLAVYFQQTVPLIQHYARQGLLRRVNGEKEIQQVEREMVTSLR